MQVFEAKHRIDQRVFAIKRIKLKNRLISIFFSWVWWTSVFDVCFCFWRQNAREKVLREVRTLAKLESPYIVRYFHSWFEYPPVKWQKNIDNTLFKHTDSNSTAPTFTSLFSGQSLSATDTTTDTNTSYRKTEVINTKSSNSSSSFIVFENSDNQKTTGAWSDDDDDDPKMKTTVSMSKSDATDKTETEIFYIYIQMELCQRETLRHWIDLYKYERRERHHILNIFEQILHAISYIHSKDLIHRDLKVNCLRLWISFPALHSSIAYNLVFCWFHCQPGNIFLSLDGKTIKVGDFGLVVSAEEQFDDDDDLKTSSENQSCTNTNGSLKKPTKSNDGTFLYMSPEQVKFKFMIYFDTGIRITLYLSILSIYIQELFLNDISFHTQTKIIFSYFEQIK